jgi:predicted secreted protein
MKKILTNLGLIILASTVSACHSQMNTEKIFRAPKTQELTNEEHSVETQKNANENDNTITLAVGESHTISMPSNKTTGFSFRYSVSGNLESITVESEYQKPPARQKQQLGAAGKQLFTIKAIKPGTAYITLAYGRLWDESSYTQTAKYTIIVNK